MFLVLQPRFLRDGSECNHSRPKDSGNSTRETFSSPANNKHVDSFSRLVFRVRARLSLFFLFAYPKQRYFPKDIHTTTTRIRDTGRWTIRAMEESRERERERDGWRSEGTFVIATSSCSFFSSRAIKNNYYHHHHHHRHISRSCSVSRLIRFSFSGIGRCTGVHEATTSQCLECSGITHAHRVPYSEQTNSRIPVMSLDDGLGTIVRAN